MSLPNCATLLHQCHCCIKDLQMILTKRASDRQHKQHLHRKHRDHQQWDCPPPVLLDPWFCDPEQFQIQHSKQKRGSQQKSGNHFSMQDSLEYSGII